MKRTISIILAAAACLSLAVSCRKPVVEEPQAPVLTVKSSVLTVPAEGGEGTIVCEAEGAVQAVSAKSWCQVSVSGKTVQYSVPSVNDSRETRYSRITITSGGEEVHVTVQQTGYVLTDLHFGSREVAFAEGSIELPYLSTFPLTASSDAEWLTVTVGDEAIVVDYAENESSDSRTGQISFTAGSETGSLTVVQKGMPNPYEMWLGEWTVPTSAGTSTWTIRENVPNESFYIEGICGYDPDRNATGAFVANALYDAEKNQLSIKVQENSAVSWNDASRGAVNPMLSGQYTNVSGSTYYNTNTTVTMVHAELAEDKASFNLVSHSVISGGSPAYFFCIRWYGRYTNGSSRSGFAIDSVTTPIPGTGTRK